MNTSTSYTNSTEDLQELPPGIAAIYQSFVASNELCSATRHILDLATHLTGAENCSLMLLNGQGELYVLNARGLREAHLRSSRIKVGDGIAGHVAMDGSPLLVEDISADQRFPLHRRNRYRTGSFIACPVTTRQKVIGVLNLNDKKNGQPFNLEDFDQARLISMIAAVAVRSFSESCKINIQESDVDDIYQRLIEAECSKREFIARISHAIRTPLNNIKGAAYYLRTSSGGDPTDHQDFCEIIEKEVNYLISCVDQGTHDYERMHNRLLDIEEREKYKHLLD